MITALLIGVALLGLAYLAYKLTTAALRKYRQKKDTQIAIADFKDIIRNMPDKEKHKYSFDELEQMSDKQVIAEYDKNSDDFVQAQFIGPEGMDSNIEAVLKKNDGFIIIED
jgi:hypothetical protein